MLQEEQEQQRKFWKKFFFRPKIFLKFLFRLRIFLDQNFLKYFQAEHFRLESCSCFLLCLIPFIVSETYSKTSGSESCAKISTAVWSLLLDEPLGCPKKRKIALLIYLFNNYRWTTKKFWDKAEGSPRLVEILTQNAKEEARKSVFLFVLVITI